MNIIKLQDELKGVPDNALIGYVQNPTGQVPTYLALSELQRRKTMREKFQQQQASQTTVAEDLAAPPPPPPMQQGIAAVAPQQMAMASQPEMPMEQMAQGGLAELDTGDMYDEQIYAQGGIVAFDDGGEVPGFAGPDGSYVNPGMYGDSVKEYVPWYKKLGLLEGLTGPTPGEDILKAYEKQSMNPFLGGMPRTDLANEYAILRDKASQNKASQADYDRMNEINNSMKSPIMEPSGGGWTKEKQAEADAKEKQAQLLKDKEKAYKDAASKISTGGAKEKIKSLADYTKEFRDVVGEDPMQAKLMERMERMDAAAAKQAEQAPWMALAQAGFGMAAGKSPYALQNIAVGAMEGVKSYGDAKDKLNDKKMANDMQMRLLDNTFDLQKTQMQTAAKDLPNAVERATKIDPLVIDDKDYKEGLKALEDKYGDKGVIPGSPNHNKYQADVDKLYRQIYAKKIRNPLAASSFGAGALSYTPGKGFN